MEDFRLLIITAYDGNTEEVARLIPLVDPKGFDSAALKSAVAGQHIDCVTLLIPVSDVSASNNTVLMMALSVQDQQIFDLLYPLSDAVSLKQALKQDNPKSNLLRTFIAQYETNIITAQLPVPTTQRLNKKI